ncbi:hypothetical protein BDQ12DRAFT_676714 [Crucibulum laeve]|uniref:Uncharacterized protein n=1 Tax=Crucibulum laeve TaxID=68775 RepID=A0A5C3MC10_9AGAR|nr:hypothetical protein BDQ12DRAFT_676714 [Crucibulum laeve]
MACSTNESPILIAPRPVLVAPRPVRLTTHSLFNRSPIRLVSAPADHPDRPRLSDGTDSDDSVISLSSEVPSDKDVACSRASPRSALSSEALEEFLSILRPSFFPPTSPILRSRRSAAANLPTFQYERPFSFKSLGRLENMLPKYDHDEADISRSSQPSRASTSKTPDYTDAENIIDGDFTETENMSFRWFPSGVLSSPISRMHTRNPFQRQGSTKSPGPMSPISPLSPAAIPLPLPTPDEMTEMS